MFRTLTMITPVLALSLSACLPQDPTVGTGPIELSQRVQLGFDAYQKERAPGHFAVSIDGREAAYNYCPSGRCLAGSKPEALNRCEERSGGVPCKIYGSKGVVVWNTDLKSDG